MPSLQSSKPLLTKHITLPTLLRLPLELRQHIYSYLLPREDVLHPLPLAGLTSVSHRPPAAALLNIHPTITREILQLPRRDIAPLARPLLAVYRPISDREYSQRAALSSVAPLASIGLLVHVSYVQIPRSMPRARRPGARGQ